MVRNEPETEIYQPLVLLVAQPGDERLRHQWLAHAIRRETIFGKAKVEERRYRERVRAELLLRLGKVGAADEANGDFVAEGREELEHGGRNKLGLVRFMTFGGSIGCEKSIARAFAAVDKDNVPFSAG